MDAIDGKDSIVLVAFVVDVVVDDDDDDDDVSYKILQNSLVRS